MGLTRLPAHIAQGLKLPLIAAPMLRVSGPNLVAAACLNGIIGAFPTQNPYLAQAPGGLDAWLSEIRARLSGKDHAALCANLIMRTPDLDAHVDALVHHQVKMVITSVGSPKAVLPRLQGAGVTVFSDVATLEHARKAMDAGVDGLILLCAGAGGQTGWLNPFAFVRAVRSIFDGPIVLAGGISDGIALRAAELLGCDLCYMGTRFIAARESMASDDYRDLLVRASMDDVVLTRAFTGLSGNYLRQTIEDAGLDPRRLEESISEEHARARFGARAAGPKRWTDIKSAGHSVSGVSSIQSIADIVAQTRREYESA